jgi:type IV pilus assembly protein PilP
MTMTRILCIALLVIVPTVVGARQQPPAQPAPATPPPATPPAGGQPAPQPEAAKGTAKPAYAYEPAGRRDPFVSLLGRGEDTAQQAARPSGVSGLMIGEVTVKGVLRDKSGFLAMLRAPDNKTYTVRVGDRLLDGSVKSINQDKVIFSQDVNDPLSLVKQREVPKPVRQAEGRGE